MKESFNPYWKKTTDRYKKKMEEKLNLYKDNEKIIKIMTQLRYIY